MQNLRDKFLKLGIVNETDVKRAEEKKASPPPPPKRDERRDERPPRRDDRPRHDARPARPPAPRRDEPVASRIPKLPPMAGTKEANRLAAKKQLENDKHLRELVLANTVAVEAGATTFYFVTRKNKLRRLEMTEAQKAKLESGELAVVERPDPDKIEHALVPAAIAEQIKVISERAVRFLNKEGAKVGFLSDDEIHARANEADAPEAPEATPAAESPSKDEPQTFITIKRAPIT